MSQVAPVSVAELQQLVRQAKATSEKFVTNFFLSYPQWATWIERGLRLAYANERVVLLVWPEDGCDRLFFAGDRLAVLSAMGSGMALGERTIAMDLVGRRADTQQFGTELESCGFRKHLRLFRLSCLDPLVKASGRTELAASQMAVATDAGCLRQLLAENFDPYADQLPSGIAIQEAIGAGEIRVVRRDGHVDGFVWFTRAEATALIRFWCVAGSARGCGVGGQLMRDYFNANRQCQRHLLWVRENNAIAAACYHHYGYRPDSLEDLVVVCEK